MDNYKVNIRRWLYPASWIYGFVTAVRNRLFDWNIKRSKSYELPIVCVGNIAVGGTGKTPHTEYLIRLLQDEFKVAVLSRGYKRTTSGYLLADEHCNASRIGDEPFQIHAKFPTARVAVDANRCHGVECLMKLDNPAVDVVLLDDAFQHRHIKAGLNILLTDYHRLLCDDTFLPAGLLRESKKGMQRAQIVIVTKCPENMMPIDYTIIMKRLKLYPYQKLYFSSFRYQKLRALFADAADKAQLELCELANKQVLLVTGIASPQALLQKVQNNSKYPVMHLAFQDHHAFGKRDMHSIKEAFEKLPKEQRILVTSEKDATRMLLHAEDLKEIQAYIYVLPVEVEILLNQKNLFERQVLDYVRKNKRKDGAINK